MFSRLRELAQELYGPGQQFKSERREMLAAYVKILRNTTRVKLQSMSQSSAGRQLVSHAHLDERTQEPESVAVALHYGPRLI